MWSESQRRCLEAIGIPVWELRERARAPDAALTVSEPQAAPEITPSEPVSRAPAANTENEQSSNVESDNKPAETEVQESVNKPAVYRLAHWHLQFPEEMAGTGFQWVRDLGVAFEDRATLVSSAPEGVTPLDCSDFAQSELSAEQKRELWARLKQIATSSHS